MSAFPVLGMGIYRVETLEMIERMENTILDELRRVLKKRAEHVSAIRKIDSYLAELRMVMDTRTSTGNGFGRPDVSSERVVGSLRQTQTAMTTAALREATGIKKTTLETVLRRLVASGVVVRDPAEWKGPNGNYRYSLNADIFDEQSYESAPSVDAVDPHAGSTGTPTTRDKE